MIIILKRRRSINRDRGKKIRKGGVDKRMRENLVERTRELTR